MRRLAQVAFVAPALALSACYHAVVDTGRPLGSTVITKRFQPSFIVGLVAPPPLNVSAECTNGVARVATEHSFVEALVGAITFGIFTPMSYIVTCASNGSSAIPTDRTVNVAEGASVEAQGAAFAEAARLAKETGEAAFVRVR
jgi:Bor protein